MADVTVCVGTFGERSWVRLALERAIPSAQSQAETIHVHDTTLARARNKALEKVESEFVVFLDADDELEPGYVEAMGISTADLRAPLVRYVQGGREARPQLPQVAGHRRAHPACSSACLPEGNWLVVGTCARTELLREVGGWREFEWSEDWDLWLRCWRAGASIAAVPGAIYRAHVSMDSRNRAPDRAFKERVHWEIHRANFPEQYQEVA